MAVYIIFDVETLQAFSDILCFFKAIPHYSCASDATSRFSSDCLNSTQVCWRKSRRIWVI